ncbi:efflux RND transporter periplasmic adaptor subunit [uncultured Desulfosarcina sp.]|uniref:efflux RND transporter periplasmic adaptor subunit n=1 Tax=uncultured Desulfosarcina sp. TaxID=218289 RepID=UPI0029C662CE|nr:efflux RND transporter periplasmic adaptor subunit [uncultured Desulfosarcina sp.]
MNQPNEGHCEPNERPPVRPIVWLRTLIVCVIILAIGIAGAGYIRKTAPRAQKRPPQRTIPLVRTQPLVKDTHQVIVAAMGSVIPAREITLKTRVAGEIRSINPEFVEGGLIRSGEKIVKIDDEDYRLAITRQESAVVDAEYALKVEMGYQDVARREWSLLNPGQAADAQDAELALRKPHLAKAQSDLVAARAELEQAQLDLARTDVVAPFNAIVREKHVAVGSQVSTQDALAELVGTDEYWIQVSLPIERLAWIRVPRSRTEKGAAVTVFYRGNRRLGTVARLLSDLETEGRMARILVSVEDPLGLKGDHPPSGPPMLIGEYVRVEIQGRTIDDVYRIPRTALRDNSSIWILGEDNTLHIVPVETVWRDADHVLIQDGIEAGDQLIVSDLSTPVAGMQLKEDTADASAVEPARTQGGEGANG